MMQSTHNGASRSVQASKQKIKTMLILQPSYFSVDKQALGIQMTIILYCEIGQINLAQALRYAFPAHPTRYCLEAHARAGMVVDIATVQEILADLVPHVMKGEPVKSLSRRRPWPQLDFGDGHTGLWWDVQ